MGLRGDIRYFHAFPPAKNRDGEEVAAVVVLKPGAEISEQDVIEFCKARLADYKCPKTVRFVEDIPKGPTGKLLKRELAQLFR